MSCTPSRRPTAPRSASSPTKGKGDAKIRNIYYMNSDGTRPHQDRRQRPRAVLEPRRDQDRLHEGRVREIHLLPTAATKGLFIYDLKTGKTRKHVNNKLHHLYTLNWSPDGKWFVATVHGGMGFLTRILAIEANGDKVFDLKLDGCRPNISPDGKKVCWGHGDYCAGVADLDFSGPIPKATQHPRRGREQEPDRDLSHHLVAGHEIPHLHARPQVQGQEPEGPGAGVSRSRGARLERVRGRRAKKGTAGSRSPRRQVVQAAELGRGQGGGGEMSRGKMRWPSVSHSRPCAAVWRTLGAVAWRPPNAGSSPRRSQTKSGVEMVLIPAGSFEMGSRHGPRTRSRCTRCWIDSFLMDRHEVTQAEYEKLGKIEAFPNPSHFQGADLPVEQVTWPQAARFCNARSRLEGLKPCYNEDTGECDFEANGYRLPTEAEWEYACRAGTDSDYSFGSDARKLGDFAWFADNSAKKTHPVGQKKPNPVGPVRHARQRGRVVPGRLRQGLLQDQPGQESRAARRAATNTSSAAAHGNRRPTPCGRAHRSARTPASPTPAWPATPSASAACGTPRSTTPKTNPATRTDHQKTSPDSPCRPVIADCPPRQPCSSTPGSSSSSS